MAIIGKTYRSSKFSGSFVVTAVLEGLVITTKSDGPEGAGFWFRESVFEAMFTEVKQALA